MKTCVCDVCKKQRKNIYRVLIENDTVFKQKNGGWIDEYTICKRCIKKFLKGKWQPYEVTENE